MCFRLIRDRRIPGCPETVLRSSRPALRRYAPAKTVWRSLTKASGVINSNAASVARNCETRMEFNFQNDERRPSPCTATLFLSSWSTLITQPSLKPHYRRWKFPYSCRHERSNAEPRVVERRLVRITIRLESYELASLVVFFSPIFII